MYLIEFVDNNRRPAGSILVPLVEASASRLVWWLLRSTGSFQLTVADADCIFFGIP